MNTTKKRPYTTPAQRIVTLNQRHPLLAGSGGGIGESDVIINIVDGGISFPDLGGGGTGDWSWSSDGIGDSSLDR
jgi:hypothetical protein